jgi:hypothetical protein
MSERSHRHWWPSRREVKENRKKLPHTIFEGDTSAERHETEHPYSSSKYPAAGYEPGESARHWSDNLVSNVLIVGGVSVAAFMEYRFHSQTHVWIDVWREHYNDLSRGDKLGYVIGSLVAGGLMGFGREARD